LRRGGNASVVRFAESLPQAGVLHKEKGLVLLNGSAKRASELVPVERRHRAAEEIARVESVVSYELE
jgi:hypothetical protein